MRVVSTIFTKNGEKNARLIYQVSKSTIENELINMQKKYVTITYFVMFELAWEWHHDMILVKLVQNDFGKSYNLEYV
jgi:hypothetical protein